MIRKIILIVTLSLISISSAVGCPVLFTKMFVYSNGSFTVVEIPGSSKAEPTAINDSGDVVGYYLDTTGSPHSFLYSGGGIQTLPNTFLPADINSSDQIVGFSNVDGALYSGGTLTMLQVAGSSQTVARAINTNGTVAGLFLNNSSFPFHPFIYSNGQLTTFDPPGNHVNNIVQDVNDAGQVLGYSVDYSAGQGLSAHGFLYNGGSFEILDAPGSAYTTTIAVNDSGDVVGSYYDRSFSLSHAYLYSKGSFTTIDVPGSPYTYPAHINDLGAIVGTYINPRASNYTNGFLYSNGQFTTLQVPGSFQTEVMGINNAGEITGNAAFIIDLLDPPTGMVCQIPISR